jgi:hypothetical protein
MPNDPKTGRERRKELIEKIGQLRKSSVVVYVCSDRSPLASAAIAKDIIRPLYDHLLALGNLSPRSGTLDLFLYSVGGDPAVPWPLVSMIRECYKNFTVLVPFRAYSAATMICLGADSIIMGRKGELGPIDPTLVRRLEGGEAHTPQIPVEDVSSYLEFIRTRAGITDQDALAQTITALAQQLQPLTLGSVNRMYSHIRLVAQKLLTSRSTKMEEDRVRVITETLTEKIYSHGHSISRREAVELGLHVEKAVSPELEQLMWDLYVEYEKLLELRDPIDPMAILDAQKTEEHTLSAVPIGCIESEKMLHAFQQELVFSRRRKMPTNPNINISLNLQLPGAAQPGLPAPAPVIPQQLVDQLMQQIGKTVRDQIIQQSELVGIQTRTVGGKWREIELNAD